jgi:hypothetical protein
LIGKGTRAAIVRSAVKPKWSATNATGAGTPKLGLASTLPVRPARRSQPIGEASSAVIRAVIEGLGHRTWLLISQYYTRHQAA